MSIDEWTKIEATLFAVENRNFQCAACLSKYDSRQDRDAMVEQTRRDKACREIRPQPFVDIDRKIFFATCPGNFTFPEVLNWLDSYRRFQTGILPFPGALMDQPAKVMEVFSVFEAHEMKRALAEKKKIEAMKRAAGSRGARGG